MGEGGDGESHAIDEAIIVGLICLGGAFAGGHILDSKHVWWLPEAGFALILGALAALAVHVLHDQSVSEFFAFDFEFFMIWLLPPIIFEAGFNMNQQTFLDAAGPMLGYAFVGTCISTFVVGGMVYGAAQLGLCPPLGGIASLTFGALISATDPVTVLSVFQALGVQPDLFALVFGESVMNDAIALVLARTFIAFKHEELNAASVFGAVGLFLYVFVASTLLGIAFGAMSAFSYKLLNLAEHESALFVETALSIVAPWCAFYLCEVVGLSGIVAILFCGMTMARYTRPNLSKPARVLTARAFKVLATVAETYIFIYLGLAVFALPILNGASWALAGIALLACLVGRAANIGLVSLSLRAFGVRVPGAYQAALFASGLRGGVAFAISAFIYEHGLFGDAAAELDVLQTTLIIAAFTIFVFGGAIEPIAHKLGVLAPEAKSDLHNEDFEHTPSSAPWSNKGHTWLDTLDRAYVAPLLTRRAYAKLEPKDTQRPSVNLRASELGVTELEKQDSSWSTGPWAKLRRTMGAATREELRRENEQLRKRLRVYEEGSPRRNPFKIRVGGVSKAAHKGGSAPTNGSG